MDTRSWIVAVLLLFAVQEISAGRHLKQASSPANDSCASHACIPFAGPLGHAGECTPGKPWCTCNTQYGMLNTTIMVPTSKQADPNATLEPLPVCRFNLDFGPYATADQGKIQVAARHTVYAYRFFTRAPDGTPVCSTPIDDGVPISEFKVEPSAEDVQAYCEEALSINEWQDHLTDGPEHVRQLHYSEVESTALSLPSQATCTPDNAWEYQFVAPTGIGCYDVTFKFGDGSAPVKFLLHVDIPLGESDSP